MGAATFRQTGVKAACASSSARHVLYNGWLRPSPCHPGSRPRLKSRRFTPGGTGGGAHNATSRRGLCKCDPRSRTLWPIVKNQWFLAICMVIENSLFKCEEVQHTQDTRCRACQSSITIYVRTFGKHTGDGASAFDYGQYRRSALYNGTRSCKENTRRSFQWNLYKGRRPITVDMKPQSGTIYTGKGRTTSCIDYCITAQSWSYMNEEVSD